MTAQLSQTTEEVTESPKGASTQGWREQVVLEMDLWGAEA